MAERMSPHLAKVLSLIPQLTENEKLVVMRHVRKPRSPMTVRGDVSSDVANLMPFGQPMSVKDIVLVIQGYRPLPPKQVYNAIVYLKRHGEIRSAGHGRYERTP